MSVTHSTYRTVVEANALREMAQDFRDVSMDTAAQLCDEKAAALLSEMDA